MDWGEGEYEIAARTLEPAATRAVEAARVKAGMRVLDLGEGTGNAALEAARRGAEVVAVDPAARLLEVCRARAAEQGLSVTVERGGAERIPASDASFDALVSVFGVIFAPDAEIATAEMLRVVRPGGTIVVTSCVPTGPIAKAGSVLREAMARVAPAPAERPAPAWGDPAFVRDLFGSRGAAVSVEEDTLAFEAASPGGVVRRSGTGSPGVAPRQAAARPGARRVGAHARAQHRGAPGRERGALALPCDEPLPRDRRDLAGVSHRRPDQSVRMITLSSWMLALVPVTETPRKTEHEIGPFTTRASGSDAGMRSMVGSSNARNGFLGSVTPSRRKTRLQDLSEGLFENTGK